MFTCVWCDREILDDDYNHVGGGDYMHCDCASEYRQETGWISCDQLVRIAAVCLVFVLCNVAACATIDVDFTAVPEFHRARYSFNGDEILSQQTAPKHNIGAVPEPTSIVLLLVSLAVLILLIKKEKQSS